MGELWLHIRALVSAAHYIVSVHASERLEERGILEWQVIAAIDTATLLFEHPSAEPNPAVEIRIALPDGTEVKAVWSWIRAIDVAKLVTVHYEGSTFAAFNGTEGKRTITSITADEMKTRNPATSTGTVAESVWRRAK